MPSDDLYSRAEGCESCRVAAFEDIVRRARAHVHARCREADSLQHALALGIEELLRLCDEHPDLARFAIVDTLTAEAPLAERREREIERLARLIGPKSPSGTEAAVDSQADLLVQARVRAALGVVHQSLQERSPTPLLALREPITNLILL